MLKTLKHRANEPELMDDFAMEGRQLTEALNKIAWINRVLGGNALTINAVRKIAKKLPAGTVINITDLGCGNGDMLRELSAMGKKEGFRFRMKGVDANAYTVQYARELSATCPEISYACDDILSPGYVWENSDIVLLTLTLHHFDEQQILYLLTQIAKSTNYAIIVNDLQRSRIAFLLFGWMSKLLRLGEMNDYDGKLSIQRGFRRKELEALARKMNFKKYTIRWKWAFRYRWIITDL